MNDDTDIDRNHPPETELPGAAKLTTRRHRRPRAKPRTVSRSLRSGNVTYTIAGSGEPVLLIHGLGGTRATWGAVIESLATTHTVIAPDLPGHGDSDAPAGDYSIGAHAAVMRDLLMSLGHGRANVIGHSLGGGVALQFAYQHPERLSRLALISSGGLGPELTVMLRAATLPGADVVVAGLAKVPERLTRAALKALAVLPGLPAHQDAGLLAEGLHGLTGSRRRRGFIATARSVIDWRGQAVSAVGHLGLLATMPVMLAWGSQDRTIPPRHHRSVADQLPNATAIEITAAGHYPHETAPEQLLPHLHTFLAGTAAFRYSETRWRRDLVGATVIDLKPSDQSTTVVVVDDPPW